MPSYDEQLAKLHLDPVLCEHLATVHNPCVVDQYVTLPFLLSELGHKLPVGELTVDYVGKSAIVCTHISWPKLVVAPPPLNDMFSS